MNKMQKKSDMTGAAVPFLGDVATVTIPGPDPEDNSHRALDGLRGSLERVAAAAEADARNKAEIDSLVAELIDLNREKKATYRRHAEQRLERQADNAAQSQVEADERETLIDKELDVYYRMQGKLKGIHPSKIMLPGMSQAPSPSAPRRKRGLLRRLFGMR